MQKAKRHRAIQYPYIRVSAWKKVEKSVCFILFSCFWLNLTNPAETLLRRNGFAGSPPFFPAFAQHEPRLLFITLLPYRPDFAVHSKTRASAPFKATCSASPVLGGTGRPSRAAMRPIPLSPSAAGFIATRALTGSAPVLPINTH